ncbi:fatty acid desaturase family protein [Agromyces albus]|uniref:fatty acid desaturase family protein n=1 Tax=Agromyces albus TaxID=205332 RepID=UPI0027806D5C|nr:acyl-CoA desaturase [Agromyces albus]MDQ0576588.1 fatty acid desaturase [Agromyces albus]
MRSPESVEPRHPSIPQAGDFPAPSHADRLESEHLQAGGYPRDTAGKSTTSWDVNISHTESLGAIRATKPRTGDADITRSYTALSRVVRESGLLNRTRWFYLAVISVLTLALGGATTGFILLGDSWFQLLIAGALGLIFTQFAFLAHEASHRQVLESGPNNDRVGRLLAAGVVGISYSWWMTKHTRHHANPNKLGKDPDIDFDTISFTEKDAARQKGLLALITRKQGYLFFPLLTLEGINLHYRSIGTLFERGPVKGRWIELSLIAARFTVYLGAIFWVLPLGMAFAFLGVQLAVFGVYMGAAFAPNHKGMPIIAEDVKLDFFSKQVLTSRNVSGGIWASALLGGLNYQVEHHLFPNMPRPHLAKAREIVREHCRTVDVPYTETTLMQSYGIVINYLNRVGLAARDPFDCPMVNQFRRT